MLDRLEMLRSHQLQTVNVSNLSPNRLKTLADYALTVSATTLKRLTLKRQTAVVLAGMIMLEIRIQDLILYMVEQGFHESVTRAKYKYKEDRLQSLAEFDQAAFQLRDFAQFLVELPDDESLTIPQLFSLFQKQEIEASIASIDRVKYSESNNYRGLLVKYYRSIRRFLSLFLHLIPFQSLTEDNTALTAIRFLHQLELGNKLLQDAPRAVITSSWQAFVVDENGDIQRDAYTICVLQELLRQLRQRDIYIMPSEQWYDPRQFLIPVDQWKILKPQICRLLDRNPQPDSELDDLAQQLNDAYQQANEALLHDPNLRMEIIGGIARPIVTPLDAVPETPELLFLQQALTKRLPAVDLPDLMLEVHQTTGFADAFTHISEQQSRMTDLPVTICAILLAEGCNIGLEAVADEDVPALTFERLRFVQQNSVNHRLGWMVSCYRHEHPIKLFNSAT